MKFLKQTVADEEFIGEIALLRQQRHPAIMFYYGLSYFDDTLCLVTEFLDGGSLKDWLEDLQFNPPTTQVLLSIALDISAGMNHLAKKNVIHRYHSLLFSFWCVMFVSKGFGSPKHSCAKRCFG